jgi:hypothetical protein
LVFLPRLLLLIRLPPRIVTLLTPRPLPTSSLPQESFFWLIPTKKDTSPTLPLQTLSSIVPSSHSRTARKSAPDKPNSSYQFVKGR